MKGKCPGFKLPRTVRSLARLIKLMDEYLYVFPPSAVAKSKKLVRRFLLGYLYLAYDAFCAGRHRYKLRPKTLALHYVFYVYTMQYD